MGDFCKFDNFSPVFSVITWLKSFAAIFRKMEKCLFLNTRGFIGLMLIKEWVKSFFQCKNPDFKKKLLHKSRIYSSSCLTNLNQIHYFYYFKSKTRQLVRNKKAPWISSTTSSNQKFIVEYTFVTQTEHLVLVHSIEFVLLAKIVIILAYEYKGLYTDEKLWIKGDMEWMI